MSMALPTLSPQPQQLLKKGIIKPIKKFHTQRRENDKTKQIKAAFTSPRLNKAAQCVARVIANEPPAKMPFLHGLVQETANKSTSAMECCIQLLEDQLKVVQGKKSPKKSQGRRDEEDPSGDPQEQGHP